MTDPILYLEASRDAIVALCQPLNEEQATRPRADGGWSPAEFLEHLATAERGILIRLKRSLGAEPVTAEARSETAGKTELILQHVATPTRKVESPEALRPSGRYGAWPGALEALVEARTALLEFARATSPEQLEAIVLPHPMLGNFSGTQWLLFCAAHFDRHRKQIEEQLRA